MDATLGLIRHVLTFGGGALVTNGLITEAGLGTGVGAIVSLVGLAWSAYDKYRKRFALDKAIAGR